MLAITGSSPTKQNRKEQKRGNAKEKKGNRMLSCPIAATRRVAVKFPLACADKDMTGDPEAEDTTSNKRTCLLLTCKKKAEGKEQKKIPFQTP